MQGTIKAIKYLTVVNKAHRKAVSTGKIDIMLSNVYLLYFIQLLPPPAGFMQLFRLCHSLGKTVSADQLKNKIDLLIDKGYLERNGWGKASITPVGLNLLHTFEAQLRKEKVI